jgi:hypothetical protein
MMTDDLKQLLTKIQVKQYMKSPPKKQLMHILNIIELKKHYGYRRAWDMLVEFLAKYIVQHEDLTLASMSCKPFLGLDMKRDKELYDHLGHLDLLRHYVTAAKAQPWDHLGEVYTDLRLVGLGQNMTPKGVVDMMIKMTYGEGPKKFSTQLDPCVGTGRFLFEASILFPKAPIVLFGVEINLYLYRACLVNMALFSNHPYSIICADTLRLDPDKSGPTSKLWDLGNRWDPTDVSAFYWKPTPPFKQYMKMCAQDKPK